MVLTRWGVLVLSAALLLLPGCGASDVSPETAVADAATKTEEAGSSRVSFTGTLTDPELSDRPIAFSGEGEFDYDDARGTFSYDLTELAKALEEEPDGWHAEVIFTGESFFFRMPVLTEDLPGAKPWIELGSGTDTSLAELMELGGGSDPTKLLQFMRGSSGGVERVGSETVRGVRTMRYQATIELAKVLERIPDEGDRETLRKQLEQREKQGLAATQEMEVWIDAEGLARRIRMDDPEGSKERATVTMDLFDFGVEVDAEPPPDDEVMSEDEFDALLEAK